MSNFEKLGKLLESEFEQDLDQVEKHPTWEIHYKKVAVTPDENLAVVNRIGWDTKSGSSHNFTVFHIPTRTDLGFLFTNIDEAEKFMKEIAEKYDWDFTEMGGQSSKHIDQEDLYRIAARHNARNVLGNLIMKKTRA